MKQSLMRMMYILFLKRTNAAYKLDDMVSKELSKTSVIYILGEQCYDQESFNIAKENILWFSYRSHIPYDGLLITDQGWGCLIRVGQMILANALSRIGVQSLSLFKESIVGAPYQIQEIMTVAQNEYDIAVGQWYTAPKIIAILAQLCNQLNIRNFTEQCIFQNQIQFNKPLLIVVHLVISTQDINSLKEYMALPYFMGAICGRADKAYYLLGFQDDLAIYLDPHYVQHVDQETYTGNLKTIDINKLSYDVSLAFLIIDEDQYNHLCERIQKNGLFSVIDDDSLNDI